MLFRSHPRTPGRTGSSETVAASAPVGAQFVEDGSFAKLREISLTYTLDNSMFKNLTGFSSADIRIAGRNLKTWTKYSGFDPEVNLGGAEFLTQGLDYFINPPTRSFVLSFSLSR